MMPTKVKCERCGVEYGIGDYPFCRGGHGKMDALTIIGDDIPGGMIIENLGSRPQRFYTRSAFKQAMAAKGVEPYVKHVGSPGSDKSKFTQRWI